MHAAELIDSTQGSTLRCLSSLRTLLLVSQVYNGVTDPRVDEHVPTKLVHLLPGLSRRVRVESCHGTVPDELHASWRCQPEDAALPVLAVPRRHDDGHRLFQHHLQAGGQCNAN